MRKLMLWAVVLAMLVSIGAAPVLADHRHGDNDRDWDRGDRDWGHPFGDHDFDFWADYFDRYDDDEDDEFDLDDLEDFFGDVDNDSGDIDYDSDVTIAGDNNNACIGSLQFGNTGNFTNQQGVLQYGSDADDIELEGMDVVFSPENSTSCDQAVEQAAAASSYGWGW